MKERRVFDILRARLLGEDRVDLEMLYQHKWSRDFEQRMRDHLVMGAIRYEGASPVFVRSGYDYMATARRELDRYLEDGNGDRLVDVAVYCLLEYVMPNHPRFRVTPRDESDHAIALETSNSEARRPCGCKLVTASKGLEGSTEDYTGLTAHRTKRPIDF